MAKSIKKKAEPKKSTPAKKPARVKTPVPVIETSVEQPVHELPAQESPKNENAAIMNAYPQLTHADFFMYAGELRPSLLGRLAEKLGVNVSVLEELEGK